MEFPTWREPEAILEMAQLLVYRRPGVDEGRASDWVQQHVTFIDAPQLDLSSTVLRTSLRSGRSVRDLAPDDVLAYIEEHELYG